MTPKLNVGLRIPVETPLDAAALRAFVLRSEALGFHSIWAGDHVYHHTDIAEPLHVLAWVAALTTRPRIGTAVMLTAYRDPVLLAKAAASLDALSGGRLTLGVSIGGSEAEYASMGVPMDQRVGRLLEAVRIMRRLWLENDVAFEGRYHQIKDGNVRPKPVQQPIPLLFGAGNEAMLRRLARVADGWIGSAGGSVDAFLDNLRKVRSFAADRGRDPDHLVYAKLQSISVHRDRDAAFAQAERHWRAYYGPRYDVEASAIYGTPDECATRLRRFLAADANELTLILEPAGLDLAQVELLAETAAALGG